MGNFLEFIKYFYVRSGGLLVLTSILIINNAFDFDRIQRVVFYVFFFFYFTIHSYLIYRLDVKQSQEFAVLEAKIDLIIAKLNR